MRAAVLPAVLAVLAVVVASDDDTWTRADAAAHADRFNDPDAWRRDLLGGDLSAQRERSATAEWLPFSWTVFPAPDPASTGRVPAALGIGPLDLPDPLVGLHAYVTLDADDAEVDYAELTLRPVLALVARGELPLQVVDTQAVARNHPHALFQATLASDDGEVDVVALELADGTAVAIVNGRVLDLRVGNVVVVRQRDDGSVEVFQHRDVVEPAARADVAAEIGRRLGDPAAQAFWR